MPSKKDWEKEFRREHSGFSKKIVNEAIALARKKVFYHNKDFYNYAQKQFMYLFDKEYGL